MTPDPKGNTPSRSVRIPDDLWNALLSAAASEGRTPSNLIVRLLRDALGGPSMAPADPDPIIPRQPPPIKPIPVRRSAAAMEAMAAPNKAVTRALANAYQPQLGPTQAAPGTRLKTRTR